MLVALWLLFCGGCGRGPAPALAPSGSPSGPSSPEAKRALRVGLVTDNGGRGDQSFNVSAIAGLERAAGDLGIEQKVLESRSEDDYAAHLNSFAGGGFDLIVAVGYALTDAVRDAAARYPKVKFVIVDGHVQAPNVQCLLFREEEGAFLAGALAAQMTKRGRIGFVGGKKIPLIEKFEAGYRAGARTVNPRVKVFVFHTGAWDDPAAGNAAALVAFDLGADVIFHAAGACGIGVIEAAKQKGEGFWAIGCDTDQDGLAQGVVLTSMVKHVDNALYASIKDLQAGRFDAGASWHSLKDDGVGLSEMQYTRDRIPDTALATLERLREAIVKGRLVVPDTLRKLKSYQPPKFVHRSAGQTP